MSFAATSFIFYLSDEMDLNFILPSHNLDSITSTKPFHILYHSFDKVQALITSFWD
jgi:hypothetical protein